MWVLIKGVLNPPSTATTESFLLRTSDSGGYLITESRSSIAFTADPGSMTIPSNWIRSDTGISSITKLTLSFINKDAYPKNSLINIELPEIQVLRKSADALKCLQKGTTKDLACSDDSTDSVKKTFTIKMNEFCSNGANTCVANSLHEVTIDSGIMNPLFVPDSLTSTSSSISIYQSASVKYDVYTSTLTYSPTLIPEVVGSLDLVRSGSSEVQGDSEFDATFGLLPFWKVQSSNNLKFIFPDSFLTTPKVFCFYAGNNFPCVSTNYVSGYLKDVLISNFCQNNCSISLATVKFKGLLNAKTTAPMQSTSFFEIQELSSTNLLHATGKITDFTKFPLTSKLFSPVPNLKFLDSTTGVLTDFTLIFQLSVELVSSGRIVVFIPLDITISTATTCQTTIAGVLATFICTPDITNRKMLITHFDSNPTELLNKDITLTVQKISNPNLLKITDSFKLTSESAGYSIQESTFTYIPTASRLLDIKFIRSETKISQTVVLTITINIQNSLPTNPVLTIMISEDILIVPDINLISLQGVTGYTKSIEIVSTNKFLKFVLTLTNCPCIPKSIEYILSGGNNPGSTKTPTISSQAIIKSSDNFEIQSKISDLFASPLLSSGPLTVISVTSSNRKVGQLTLVEIVIESTNALATPGVIIITLPLDLFYANNQNCVSKINGATVTCLKTDANGKLGQSISILKLTGACPSVDCPIKTKFTISLGGFMYNAQGISNELFSSSDYIIQTIDSNGFVLDAVQINVGNIKPNEPNDLSSPSITRAGNFAGISTSLKLAFTSSIRYLLASKAFLAIPLESAIPFDTLKCTVSTTIVNCNVLAAQSNSTHNLLSIDSFCINSTGTYCERNRLFEIQIDGFINGYYQVDSDTNKYVASVVYGSGYDLIEKVANLFTASPNIVSSTLASITSSLSSLVVSSNTNFKITFDCISGIPSNSMIKVTFPMSEFSGNQNTNCLQAIATQSEVSFPNCLSANSGNYIGLINLGNQNVIQKATKIVITLNMINFQYAKVLANKLSVLAYFQKETQSIFTGELSLNSMPSLTPITLDSNYIDVKRDNLNAGSTTNLMIYLNLLIEKITSASIITLYLPKNELSIGVNSLNANVYTPKDTSFKYNFIQDLENVSLDSDSKVNSKVITLTLSATNSNTTHYSYDLPVSTVAAFDIFYFAIKINGLISNSPVVPSPISPNEVYIIVQYNGLKRFQSQNIFIKESLKPASLTQALISRSSNTLSNLVELTVTFTSSITTIERILIEFPAAKVMYPATITGVNPSTQQGTFSIYKTSDGNGESYISRVLIRGTLTSPLKLSNFQNPGYVRTTSKEKFTLSILTTDESSVIQSKDDNITPALPIYNITKASFLKTSAVLSKSTSLKVSFELLSNALPNYFITLTLSKTDIETTNLNGISLQATNSLKISSVREEYQNIIVSLSTLCSCKIFDFTLDGFQNPSVSISPSSSVINYGISPFDSIAFTNYVLVMSPTLYTLRIEKVTIAKNNEGAGKNSNVTFIMTLSDLIYNVSVSIDVPSKLLFKADSQECFYYQNNQRIVWKCDFAYNGNEISQVIVKFICISSTECPKSQNIIFGFVAQNPPIAYNFPSTNTFTISLLNGGSFLLIKDDFPIQITNVLANVITSSIVNSSNLSVAAKNVTLNISIILPSNLKSTNLNGRLEIEIPSALNPKSCSTSNIDLTCSVTSHKVILKHSNDLLIFQGKTLFVLIKEFDNLPSNSTNPSFIIKTYQDFNGLNGVTDQITDGIIYSATILGGLSNITAQRSNIDLGSPSTFNFTFTLLNPLSSRSSIYINVEKSGQAQFDSTTSPLCIDIEIILLVNCTFFGKYLIINEICSTYSCNQGKSLRVSVIRGIVNQDYARQEYQSEDSFTILTYDYLTKGFVDQAFLNIIASPKLQTLKFQINNLKINSTILCSFVEVSINFTQVSNSTLIKTSSLFRISLPKNNFYIQNVASCFSNNISISCETSSSILNNYLIGKFDSSMLNLTASSMMVSLELTNSLSYIYLDIGENDIFGNFQPIYQSNSSYISQSIKPKAFESIEIKVFYNPTIQILFSFQSECPIPSLFQFKVIYETAFIINTTENSYKADFLSIQQNFNNMAGLKSRRRFLQSTDNNSISFSVNTSIIPRPSNNHILMQSVFNDYSYGIKNISFEIISNNQIISSNSMKNVEIPVFNISNNISNCQLSYANGTKCLTCRKPSSQPLIENNICTSQCSEGTFLYNDICMKCYSSCKSCTGPDINQCSTCNPDSKLFGGYCVPTNCSYCQTFNLCNGNCSTCTTDKEYCLSCKQGSLKDGKCVENCTIGFTSIDNICVKCNDRCLSCSGNATNCTTCNSYFEEEYFLSGVGCVKLCPSNYFISGKDCTKCHDSCNSCFGPNSNQCLSCKPNTFLSGYSCVNQCSSEENIINSTQMACESKSCPNTNCMNCNNSSCIKCKTGSLNNSTCQDSCPSSFFQNNAQICTACSTTCKTCNNSSKCTQCSNSLVLLNNECSTFCPNRFFIKEGICNRCSSNCLQCSEFDSNCLICDSGMKIFDKKCFEKCPANTFEFKTECILFERFLDGFLNGFPLILIILFLFASIWISATLIIRKTCKYLPSGIISLVSSIELISRFFLLIQMFIDEERYLISIAFIAFAYPILSGVLLYITMFRILEHTMSKFGILSKYKVGNLKKYKILKCLGCIFGPMYYEIFKSNLLFIGERDTPLLRLPKKNLLADFTFYSHFFSLLSFIVSIYNLSVGNLSLTIFHISYLNITFLLLIYLFIVIQIVLLFIKGKSMKSNSGDNNSKFNKKKRGILESQVDFKSPNN